MPADKLAATIQCELCGEPIPRGAPWGYCPACLLSLASTSDDAPMNDDDLLSATQVRSIGDYELIEEIARGGMGVVYRARQISLGREVAVKMILAAELASAEAVQRFRNEAAAAAQLEHPNIVSVHEIGEHETQHFFSMRLVSGRRNIAQWAKALARSADEHPSGVPEGHEKLAGGEARNERNPRINTTTRPAPAGAAEDSGTPAGVRSVFDGSRWFRSFLASPPANVFRPSGTAERAAQIAAMMAKVARAVAFAHERGVLHRDLKPSNILVDENGEPQITDFGLAKLVSDDSSLTLSAVMLGSPSYMAPEQAEARHRDVTTATDVYGLGAVLYELLAGRPPFVGPTPLATARLVMEQMPAPLPEAPRDLATICLKCLAKEPAQRYATANALAEDLERFASGQTIRARPVTAPEAIWRWARRKPAIAALLATLVLAFVLGFAGVTWQWRAAETARRTTETAQHGEASALAKATTTVVDLYTNAGLVAAKEEDTTRAALWFAQAAVTPGADAAGREANRARWAAWRSESVTAVRAFESGIGGAEAIVWSPSQEAIIVTPWQPPSARAGGWATVAAVWDVCGESRWRPEVAMTAAEWARRGERIVFADGKTVRLAEYPSGRELARVPCETASLSLAVSGDDRWIAVGARSPFLWDAASGKTVPLPTEAGAPLGLEFSRDGRRLLLTSLKLRGVCALDQPERFLFPPVENLGGMTQGFLAGGDLFIAHNLSNKLLVLNSDTGAVVESRSLPSDPVTTPQAISPDGRFIGRGSAALLERSDKEHPIRQHTNQFDIDFSRDSSLCVTASLDDTVRLRRLPDASDGRVIGWHQEGALAAAISPDNRLIATGQPGGSLVRIWRLGEPPAGRTLSGFGNARIRLSRDGHLLVPSGGPQFSVPTPRARVHRVDTLEPLGPEIVRPGGILDANFAPDGAWLAVLSSTTPNRHPANPPQPGAATLELLDFRSGERLGEPFVFSFEARALAVHPAGKKIAVYGFRRTLHEIDLATREVRQLHTDTKNYADYTNAYCRYSPDGRMLVAWGMGPPPLAWDAVAEKFVATPQWDRSNVMTMDFHGDVAGSGSLESEMDFVSLPGGQSAAPRLRGTNWIFVTRFSPEGHLLLTGGRGRIGRVWDWRQGKLHCPALPHEDEIFGGAFLPGTECVATGGLDRTIRLWDRRTGRPLRAPLRQAGQVMNLTVTPDGRTLISDSRNGGAIHLYDIAAILPRPALPPDDALLLAEIDAAATVERGTLEPLTAEAWMKKWREFRRKFPEWHQLPDGPDR